MTRNKKIPRRRQSREKHLCPNMAEAPRLAHIWKEDETALMLARLKALNILKYMDGRKTRNGDLFKKVAEQLKEAGFARTADQVRIRWKHLKSSYYQSRKNKKNGRKTVACLFGDALEELLGPRPSSLVRHDGEDTGFDSPLGELRTLVYLGTCQFQPGLVVTKTCQWGLTLRTCCFL